MNSAAKGYAPDAANVLYRVVNNRYLKNGPMNITTNKPLPALGQVLHDADLAQAILNRILERGTSLRPPWPLLQNPPLQAGGRLGR